MLKKKSEVVALILAAGEGTRMKSRTPKVLHPLGGRTILEWVLQTTRQAGARKQLVVLGHQADRVAKTLPAGVRTVIQAKPLGTGDAVKSARKVLAHTRGVLLVVCGDAPLFRPETFRQLIGVHHSQQAKATVLTAKLQDAYGYGRIVRDPDHPEWIARIVEEPEASASEQMLSEVNSGAYCFSLPDLWEVIAELQNQNQKGEYYLTDVVELMRRRDYPVVAARVVEDPEEILGINSRQDLAQAAAILNSRTIQALMQSGVTIWEPQQTWVDPGVKVGPDTVIYPGTFLRGKTVIGEACCLGPNAYLESCCLGKEVMVSYSVLEQARVADRVSIGPFSHLRAGTVVAADVHIGNFAEINRSQIQSGVKIGHVSYLGDAQVGKGANIGAGSITANFDGQRKHPTRIGEQAFIGSGTIMVAPCQIGRRGLTGAGAVLKRGTKIPPEMVAVGVPARVIKRRDK